MHYFNISVGQKILPITERLPVEINFDLGKTPLSRFKILPQIETGTIELVETESSLTETIEVKINNPNSNKTNIWLLVQDTKTGKVYETNRITIWGRNIYETYLRQINENIRNWLINDKMNE